MFSRAALLLALGLPQPCMAASKTSPTSVAVGAKAQHRPALSLQFAVDAKSALHLTTSYQRESVEIDIDHQRFVALPSVLMPRQAKARAYVGAGLRGFAGNADDTREQYQLRLPLGCEAELIAAKTGVFAEMAALLGPLPETVIKGSYAVGLRTRF